MRCNIFMKYFLSYLVYYPTTNSQVIPETTYKDIQLCINTTDFHFSMIYVSYTPCILKHGYNIQ